MFFCIRCSNIDSLPWKDFSADAHTSGIAQSLKELDLSFVYFWLSSSLGFTHNAETGQVFCPVVVTGRGDTAVEASVWHSVTSLIGTDWRARRAHKHLTLRPGLHPRHSHFGLTSHCREICVPSFRLCTGRHPRGIGDRHRAPRGEAV